MEVLQGVLDILCIYQLYYILLEISSYLRIIPLGDSKQNSIEFTGFTIRVSPKYGRNFVVKCGGDSLVRNQYSPRVDAECTSDVFCIQIPNLISRGVLRATLITLCFILADDLHVNILKFVAGHGTVVQTVSINIVFGGKQAQQYSRPHHLG